MRRVMICGLFFLAAMVSSAPTSADIIAFTSLSSFSAASLANSLTQETVITPGISSGNTVSGFTSATNSELYVSSQRDLTATSISSEVIVLPYHDPTEPFPVPNYFTDFSIFLPNQGSFTSLAFNLGFEIGTLGTVPITVLEVNGDITQSLHSIGVLGGNFIGLIAINGQRILSVGDAELLGFPITAISGMRIGGIQASSTPIPEPTSMLLLGTGLAGAGVRRWRRRRTA